MNEDIAVRECIEWTKEKKEKDLQEKLAKKTKDLMDEFEGKVYHVRISSNWKVKFNIIWEEEPWVSKNKLEDEY